MSGQRQREVHERATGSAVRVQTRARHACVHGVNKVLPGDQNRGNHTRAVRRKLRTHLKRHGARHAAQLEDHLFVVELATHGAIGEDERPLGHLCVLAGAVF